MEKILVFDSMSFPAASGGDPDATEAIAHGVPLLKLILSLLDEESMAVLVAPLAEGSGCSAYVSVAGTDVGLHLTWYRTGSHTGFQRDLWTLQVGPSGGWMKRLFRTFRNVDDPARETVARAVERALRQRVDEFSDVEACAWTDLD